MRIVWDLWDNIKHTNIHIIGVSEREEKEKGAENLFEEIIDENFPKLGKETNFQIQESQRVPNKMNQKKSTQRNTAITMAKIKDREKILKAAKQKQLVMYKATLIRPSAHILAETLQARKEWHNIFKGMKGKKL